MIRADKSGDKLIDAPTGDAGSLTAEQMARVIEVARNAPIPMFDLDVDGHVTCFDIPSQKDVLSDGTLSVAPLSRAQFDALLFTVPYDDVDPTTVIRFEPEEAPRAQTVIDIITNKIFQPFDQCAADLIGRLGFPKTLECVHVFQKAMLEKRTDALGHCVLQSYVASKQEDRCFRVGKLSVLSRSGQWMTLWGENGVKLKPKTLTRVRVDLDQTELNERM
eukprot:m.189068 g.189068  ORF g.189068 m.189068 type:complete len:220 (+) comp15098_c0_seq2:62-721(+)